MRTILIAKSPSSFQRISCLFTAVALLVSASSAQEPAKPARLTFEVASIRLAKPGSEGGYIKPLPGGEAYTAKNVPIKLIISLMYKIPNRQITGGPDWMNSEGYDIEAKADGPHSVDDLHTMFQNLLADRFGLKFHKEIKEGNVYALTLDTPGSRMKPNENPEPSDIPIMGGPDGILHGVGVPMPYLTWTLSQILQRDERPVVDLTGLKQKYNFNLAFAPELPPDFPKERLPPGMLDRPSIFDALKEQLGLKLTAQKGPVEYYVIDHIDKPSEN